MSSHTTSSTTSVQTAADGTVTVTTSSVTTIPAPAAPTAIAPFALPASRGVAAAGATVLAQSLALSAVRGAAVVPGPSRRARGATQIEEGPLCITGLGTPTSPPPDLGAVYGELVMGPNGQPDPARITEHWIVKDAFFQAPEVTLAYAADPNARPASQKTFSGWYAETWANRLAEGPLSYARLDIVYRAPPADLNTLSVPPGYTSDVLDVFVLEEGKPELRAGVLVRSVPLQGPPNHLDHWYLSSGYDAPKFAVSKTALRRRGPLPGPLGGFLTAERNAFLSDPATNDAALLVVAAVNWTPLS